MAETEEKPVCELIGTNGNTLALLSRVASCLKHAKMPDEAKECQTRVFAAESYNKALQIMMEYVKVT